MRVCIGWLLTLFDIDTDHKRAMADSRDQSWPSLRRGMRAPIADARVHTTVHHGRSHEDPYAWLRDQCWKEALRDPNRLSTAIRRHLDAENEYAAAVLAPLLPWVAELRAEMELRVPDADETVPQRHGPYAYWQRFRAGAEQPLFCRHGDDG